MQQKRHRTLKNLGTMPLPLFCLDFQGLRFRREMPQDRTADKADDKGHDPAETVRRQGNGGDDGFGKGQAAEARQGFQASEEGDQVDRTFIRPLIRQQGTDDAQYQQGQARRIGNAEDPADVGDDAIDAEEGRQRRKEGAGDSRLFITDAAMDGRAGEFGHSGDLTDGCRQAGQDDGDAHGDHDPGADAVDDGYQELSPADGLRIIGTDAGPHVEQAAVDDEQQDEGDDAAVDENFIALAYSRIALAVNGAEEDGGHDEADQDVARIVAAEEGIDEGIVRRRFCRRSQGEENPGNGDGHQNEGQGRRQILAHAVHDVMRVGDEEIAEQKIDDD